MATEYTTVKMDDGREVKFAGKRKMLKDTSISEDGFTVTTRLDFVNGETRTFSIEANASLFAKFAGHGIEQKLGDEIAGLDDVEDAIMAIDEIMDRLNEGNWGVKRESNAMAGTSVLARALVEHTGKPIDAIKTFLAGKSVAEKLALRKNEKIAPIVARLEADKKPKAAKPVAATDHLLDELAA